MEAIIMSLTNTKIITNPSSRTHQDLALLNKISPNPQVNLSFKKKRCVASGCVASGSGYTAAMEPIAAAMEAITAEEEEELMQRRGKCGGEENRGVLELLECLEMEAIMGDDDGREAKDYNRRAKIFDKSSRMFKNIKEHKDQSQE